jgi:spore germination protein GerM
VSKQNKLITIAPSMPSVFTILLLVLLAGGILACGCWWKPKEEVREITGVKVYFIKDISKRTDCICDNPVIRKIPKTRNVEKAAVLALEELMKGPTQEEHVQGYSGCLPGEGHVRGYKESYEKIVAHYKESGENIDGFGKEFLSPDGKFTPWGDKVKIKSVKIKNGIAYADFSKELYSYGGGSCFVEGIETSIENTLKQFSGVQEVKILVESREAELQP